ncbi:carbohydrate ABC transporter permease [Microlunatus flavus]|uniref:Multiple sugar transport system permease protein n=1 Tax=Microlunatus flavus TaxID=1036181 RepID=A0A1H9HMK2_9ACTN|nr:carbohydrate ABC transporter permease [Microlunatus flavus]SEQ63553.1 multiple sugar transport system permease protein [Microlunatus flavus]
MATIATPASPTQTSLAAQTAEGTRGRKPINPGRVVAWACLVVIMLVTLFPFYWMLRTSLSTSTSLFLHPGDLGPVDATLGAYKRVLGLATTAEAQAQGGSGASVNFLLYLRNSVIFAVVATAGQVFFSALAAYAFARLRWPGRDLVFFVFLTALMVPQIFTALPNFILIKNLGLLGTFPGLIAPYFFMTPFAIFFLRQFFLGISREIEEAAKLDGAGHLRLFFGIVLPMSAAPITTLAILTLINMWNEYLWPLLVGTNDDSRVLTVALGVFKQQTPNTGPDWAGLMAAVLIAALPLLIVFLLFAKRVVNSIGFSGVK